MAYCIPQELSAQLKKAAAKGEINIAKMIEMSSEQRRAMFEKYANKANAIELNTSFEKAILSTRKDALVQWAKSTFNTQAKKGLEYKNVLDKVDELSQEGAFGKNESDKFYADVIRSKLGLEIKPEEMQEIVKRSEKLNELQKKVPLTIEAQKKYEGQDLTTIKTSLEDHAFGDPDVAPDAQIEYLKSKRDTENYLESLTPSSNVRVLTSTIGRGNMLFRLGSILVNINSNNIEGVMGAVTRRIKTRKVTAPNADYALKVAKFNTKVFIQTGYDFSRSLSVKLETKVLGEEITSSQGKGKVRALGRWYQDKVFNLTQGVPDVVAASLAAGDRGNLLSIRMAYEEGFKGNQAKDRALEIFKDATLVNPQTVKGQLLKNEMIADAERSTNTDKRVLAQRSLKLRQLLNIGDLRFGDMSIPFVKTTANSIQSGLQTSGITVPIEVPIRLIKTVKLVQSGSSWGEASKEAFSGFSDTMIRAGIGSVAAFMIANAIKKEDYIGVYPIAQKERELLELKNATPNSIKIGNKWISLDWFGPLAAPLIGHLNAKKYGNNLSSYAFYYATGAGYQVLRTPGLDYVAQSLDSIKKVLTNRTGPSNVVKDIGNYAVDFIAARSIPGFVSDTAQATDTVQRDTSSKKDILAPFKSKIPFVRQTLPENRNVFGETTPTEGWRVLIFGSRVKTVQESPLVDELNRLDQVGQLPSITDVSKTSSRASDLRSQIGDEKFDKAMIEFGNRFRDRAEMFIETRSYERMPDEKKKTAIENIKSEEFDRILKKNGYRKPKK